jgi:hypothetical protein
MRIPTSLLIAATGLSVLPIARAQLPNASQQEESVQQQNQLQESAQSLLATNVPTLYESETSDVGPQSVVETKPRRTWIEAYGDEQYFYTDNMFLADHNKQDADVLVSTVQAALAPTPFEIGEGQLAPRVGYQHQWFNYDLVNSDTVEAYNVHTSTLQEVGLDTFDFNVSTVFGDLTWRQQNWLLSLGTDFRRLLDSGSYHEFYREYVPRWSIMREFPLTKATGLSLGYQGDYRVSETQNAPAGYPINYNDRTDQSLFIVGSWQLCRWAVLQPFYEFEYTHYTRIRRDDFFHSFGLTLDCPLTRNISLRAFVGYNDLNTDGLFAQDYEQLDAGGGLNLFIRF